MNYFKIIAVFVAGIIAGFAIGSFIPKKESKSDYIQKREKGYNFISPLLECDIADTILQNREIKPFKEEIEKQLKKSITDRKITRASLYFRELNDGIWFTIGNTEQFVPASLRKLPLMIAVLKTVENANDDKLLYTKIKNDLNNDYNQQQNIKPAKELVKGESYTLLELINRMIIYSDNNAFMLLGKVVNTQELDKVYLLLSMPLPNQKDDTQYQSVQTFSSFFRILYNASYLNKKNSELALSILAKSDFKAAIVEGLPQNIVVAHKFGEKSMIENNQLSVQLHDCGIVYYPNNPYILCMMTQGSDFMLLDDVIRDVSAAVYNEIDRQKKSR